MSWMIKANINNISDINALEGMLTAIYSGKAQASQVAYQLSPAHCEMMNSMLTTHPHFTDILNELIEAVCPMPPQQESAIGVDPMQAPEISQPEVEI